MAAVLRRLDAVRDLDQLVRHRKLPPDIAIPRYAAVLVGDSKFVSRAGRLRNDLDPRIWRLRAPIRGIETFARYGRGES